MEELKLEVEQLEERIAPSVMGTNPVPEGANPQPSGNPSQNPVPAGSNPEPSGP
jgi:hypothetical protein